MAIDLSLIHNSENKILLTQKSDDGIKIVQKAADSFVELNKRRIRSLVKVPNTFGLIAYMSSLCFNQSTLQFATATRWTIANLCEMNDEHYERLRKFSVRFAIGVGQSS